MIEEPEANLHPALQSKLADIIVYCKQNYHINFIIETHSEYFVRKLQYLVAKGDFKTEDVNLYYFPSQTTLSDTKGNIIPYEININSNGSLTNDFGSGFFDEAISWKFELLKLKTLN